MTGFTAWAVDGFVVFALVYLAGSLELVEPFQRYLVPETLPKYSYPFLASSNVSVPTWTLPFIGVFLPLGIIASVAAFTGSSWLEIRRACAGLCVSVSLGWAITNLLKVSIGGYRPDFLYRCWPDGNVAWASPGVPACVPHEPAGRARGTEIVSIRTLKYVVLGPGIRRSVRHRQTRGVLPLRLLDVRDAP